MICGVIDIGSNSIRLCIYEYQNNELKLLINNKAMAGLAGHVENGALTEKGIKKASEALLEHKALIHNFGIQTVYVFATASLRNVKNTEDALKSIEANTGFSIDIISGEREAMLDFDGATHSVALEQGLLVDIGGGSTELVSFENNKIMKAVSMPIGSLKLFADYVKDIFPSEKERKEIKQKVLTELNKLEAFQIKKEPVICGIGGSIRAVLKLYNDMWNLPSDNREIDIGNTINIMDLLQEEGRKRIKTVSQIVPERMHTVTPGFIILDTIASHFQSKKVIVSSFGVREGYLYNKLREQSKKF